MQGHLIVIDGTDGSGKATQTKLLVERMQAEGFAVEMISFPQYGTKSAGLVEEYLSGKYGSAKEVGPYRASLFFAVDRHDAAGRIRTWLDAGTHVIADRYVGSNMGHQGSHMTNPEERQKFFTWAAEIEHELFGIPRPTLNVILHVPADVAQQLSKDRGGWKADIQNDILETDLDHLKAAEQAYLDLPKHFNEFKIVECFEGGSLLPPEEVHQRIWTLVHPLIS